MATQAQINANRRNAAKSTGPRTSSGKAVSSRNAVTHGMTAALSDDAVRKCFDALREFMTASGAHPLPDAQGEALAFRLARAEANLAKVREGASRQIAEGDDAIRLQTEIKMTKEILEDNGVFVAPLTMRDRIKGLKLLIRLHQAGRKGARRIYRRQLRYLRLAEQWHERAQNDWLHHLEARFDEADASAKGRRDLSNEHGCGVCCAAGLS